MMKLEFKIDCKTTIKEFIYKKISRNFYGYLKEHSAVYNVDGTIKKAYEEILEGQNLTIIFQEEKKDNCLYSEKVLDILFEDDNYIVVDKPPFLQTIPSKGNPYDSVYNRLLYYFKNTTNTIHIINRLDKDTKGLVLVAKSNYARAILKDYTKVYIAITNKKLKEDIGIISLPIKRKDNTTLRMVSHDGQKAITCYELIKTENDLYEYKIDLKTGRTHQIRVHFAYLGSSLINDMLYNGIITGDKTLGLVCKEISFINPITLKKIKISSKY